MAILFIIFGIIFLIYGICLCAFANLNLGILMIVGLGILLTFYGCFYKTITHITQTGVLKYFKATILLLIIIELALVGFLYIYGESDNVTYNEDAVIVLGAGINGDKVTLPLKYRLDKAVEYSRKNPNAIIVVTGGQGFQETVTEAYAMEKYLIKNGIDKCKIMKEEYATSTSENMHYSKAILDKYFDGKYKVAVITNNFHIYRGISYAKAEGYDKVTHMHAGLQWYNLLPCYLRESLAIIKMWVIG